MNIAFTTLIILVLLLPGIFFSRFYYSGEFSKQYFKPTIFELILSTLIQSIILHTFWLILWTSVGYDLDYYVILSLISGIKDADHIEIIVKKVEPSIVNIVAYNLSLWVAALLLGILAKFLVRKLKLDRKYSMLRFQNEWHYIMSGEMLDFPGVKGTTKQVDVRSLDILVDSSSGGIIYSGLLQNYILSKDGGIELINLTNVTRKFLDPKLKEANNISATTLHGPAYRLEGSTFAIPYSSIQNIHITYISVEDLEPEVDEPSS